MDKKNQTLITEIILLGFSTNEKTNIVLFLLFLIIYLLTCFGNISIIFITIINPNLHTPMYFFICNLSFLDLCYSSIAVPKLLINTISPKKCIVLSACSLQVYCSQFLGGSECLLLALMAYDRYVAICRPLHYPLLMNWAVCYQLTAAIWIGSFLLSVVPSLAMPIPICNIQIDHFMCDILAVQKIFCTSTIKNELTLFVISFLFLFPPFIMILASYICIIVSVLTIESAKRGKAFSTCTSHLIVVVIYFSTGIAMYLGTSSYLENYQKFVTFVYIVITPMVNPLIYSLKNKEVKETFKKLKGKKLNTY